MAEFKTAKLTSETVYWSDGVTPFDGYLLLALSLPNQAGVAYTQARMYPKFPALRIPTRIKVPISNGLYNTYTYVPYNSSIDPPGSQYVAWFYDNNDVLIAGPTDFFTVEEENLTPPATVLTLPTTSGTIPDPGVLP